MNGLQINPSQTARLFQLGSDSINQTAGGGQKVIWLKSRFGNWDS